MHCDTINERFEHKIPFICSLFLSFEYAGDLGHDTDETSWDSLVNAKQISVISYSMSGYVTYVVLSDDFNVDFNWFC